METIKNIMPDNVQTVLSFFVNGKKVIEKDPDPEWTLLWYLRRKLGLTGTKYGCGEGGCGACTVMVSQYLSHEDRLEHVAVNSCLLPVCAVHGLAVTTVEGIGSTQDRLHAVQERMAKSHGSQCGFCTPGIVMSMYTLLRNNNKIAYDDIETALQGNLCRCTGYRPIIEAFKTFTEEWERHYFNDNDATPCAMGKECCRVNQKVNTPINADFGNTPFVPYDSTQEPIFPPELKINYNKYIKDVIFKGRNVVWVRPSSLQQLLSIKSYVPQSKIVAGNTEIGIEMKFKNNVYPVLVFAMFVKELHIYRVSTTGIIIGSSTTLTDLMEILKIEISKNLDRSKIFQAIKDMLRWFAGSQVRNVASIVGNIITASPISDLNPILMACSAVLNVCSSQRGYRSIILDDDFFKGYRKTSLEEDEVVVSVEIPFTNNKQFFKAYKQSRRREDDISIVTGAFSVTFSGDVLLPNAVVLDAKLCYGGMGPTTKFAKVTSESIKGRQWNQEMLHSVFVCLNEEFTLDSSVPGGMPDYRKSLCLSLFFKFYLEVLQKLHVTNGFKISNTIQFSGANEIPIMQPTSTQCFEVKNNNKIATDSVGKPVPHISALKQVTGEAMYCDDIPYIEGELYLALVFSREPHAKIKSIDASRALLAPGVVTFLSAADLYSHECNKMGPIVKDEEIFSSEIVTSRACVIGAVVATSEFSARKGKELIQVIYEKIHPTIITLEEAIANKSFFPGCPRKLKKGDLEGALLTSKYTINGCVRSGAQEHFYLETISAYALRKEDELEIIATTQNPADIQHIVSEALRIPKHKIVSKVKRLGGGFGGKETRAAILAVPVAIAAYKLRKPVRAVLTRDEDMQVTGYRHPCLIEYKAAFDEDGKITGALFNIYSNAGNSLDISCSMMERAVMHIDNCYFIPNVEVNGYVCKTNLPSNTAFRGFGAPQAMFATENMIRDVAVVVGKTYEEIVAINLYQEGFLTHFNQKLSHCTLSRCWSQCIETSHYLERKINIEQFNKLNRWKKKGIAIVPTKYGISFQTDVLMQAGALLLIYNDGSVLLSIGGIEMGQGLFTKVIQVASKVLEVDITKIHISEMSTDKVPNSSPTAASISSDLYGMAVVNACNTLNDRLNPYKMNNPSGEWEDWISAAYVDRVSLFATGYYAAPKITYDADTNSGNLYEYFTYGVACSEVIIDCLTGDHQVLRTDIVMDVGESLNPAIDIGQIEGAFMQGYGFYTIEEMIFSESGEVLSRGPGTYKIPAFSDIPKIFNVSLLKGAPNPRAVYSSKAVGEPPLFLAASVFFAIKEAIRSARLDASMPKEFVLHAPATCARIRMACEDHITNRVTSTIKEVGRPWNVVV